MFSKNRKMSQSEIDKIYEDFVKEIAFKVAQRVKSEADLKRNMDTLSGKGNGKNNSGMSESDVEELVSRLLDERENSK